MAEALFVTRKDIVKYTNVSGGVDTDKFIQYVKIAQNIHIQNYIGTKLYDKISTDIIAGNLAGHYATLVETHIKPCLVHWAMVEYLPFAAYTVSNKGVYKHSSENAENVSKTEVDFLIEKERTTAQYYTDRMIEHFSFYAAERYAEYYTNNDDNVYPDKDANFSGWVL
jgi:subtilase family serine protease|tara:strand:+ start:668 stop:1171 length:504 start_codon:yes stop_codon:yes gene_type:complete